MAVDLAEQSSGSHADLLSPADNSESAAFRPLESRQIVFACPRRSCLSVLAHGEKAESN